ncbi:hypothetical protein CIW49_30900 [Mycolicibacterium sp. P1-18]|uniref:LppA family lipoprotein n=1 Tax=Mycolicibacterium sp. P1-18 TaxID=2024615 RepID=UPI0011F2005F|nr:LppA family lipoprotein [Mycolicibacterium sp. P1-18]KAA0091479.1 hypothetical protein CIW49_30900 [Mycolicibacterium sp. P1-18]
MRPPSVHRRRPLAWVAALCVATLTGCGTTVPGAPAGPPAPRDPEAILRDRPPFEVAQQQYVAAVTDTADRVAALVPGLTWQLQENSWRGCGGDFLHTRGIQAYVLAAFSGPTPDPVWPRALRIVTDTAARLGATDVQPFVDRPGNHDLVVTGPDGVEVQFGTAKATVLSTTSDCRLRRQTPPR